LDVLVWRIPKAKKKNLTFPFYNQIKIFLDVQECFFFRWSTHKRFVDKKD